MKFSTQETITAIAASRSPALRGVVRLSGPDSAAAVCAVCAKKGNNGEISIPLSPVQPAVFAIRLDLYGENRTIPALLFVWPDGRGYTGETAAEIHTVGAAPILDRLVRRLCESGKVRLAEPGEFTLRAFLNGRIDLTRAEAVLGVIDAAGENALKTALVQLAGNLARPLSELREFLLDTLADWEAGLDFADEEISFLTPEELTRRIDAALEKIDALSAKMTGRTLAGNERRVVLYGRANAGKSTLFNRLKADFGCGDTPEAIVSNQRGTTRDWLETPVRFGEYTVRLIDTAGLDAEEMQVNGLEQAARQKTEEAVDQADLIFHCLAPEEPVPSKPSAKAVLIRTKSDLKESSSARETLPDRWITLSAQTGEGIGRLAKMAEDYFAQIESGEAVPSTAQRCRESLDEARTALLNAEKQAACDEILTASELRAALDAVGRMTGAVPTDDLLDRIFSRFCLGK